MLVGGAEALLDVEVISETQWSYRNMNDSEHKYSKYISVVNYYFPSSALFLA